MKSSKLHAFFRFVAEDNAKCKQKYLNEKCVSYIERLDGTVNSLKHKANPECIQSIDQLPHVYACNIEFAPVFINVNLKYMILFCENSMIWQRQDLLYIHFT